MSFHPLISHVHIRQSGNVDPVFPEEEPKAPEPQRRSMRRSLSKEPDVGTRAVPGHMSKWSL